MKKAINAWSVDGRTGFEAMFAQIKQAGFDGIELNVDPEGHSEHSLTLAVTQEKLDTIQALSQQYELPVVSISTSMLSYYMGSPKEAEREFAKEIIRCQLRCAKALDAGGILIVPGAVPQQESFVKAYETSKKTLEELKETILSYGIHVGVENVWNGFFMSPFDMARFIDELDCPYIGAYYDVGNVIAFSWSEYWIDVLGSRIFNIHVKDFKRSGGINSGGSFIGLTNGDVNWPKVIPAIRNTGFDGYLTAEVALEDMQDPQMTYEEFYRALSGKIEELIQL